MIEPRYYQLECNDALFNYFEDHTGNPVCAIPTGCGKSVCISMFLMRAFYRYPHQKVLVLTHVKELIVQNFKELLGMWSTAPAGINSAALNQRDYDKRIIFAGIASIHKDFAKFGKVDIIIIDECFSGDTLISTPEGSKRIDKVCCGDIVYNANGSGTVTAISNNLHYIINKVRFSNGKQMQVTDNHPIFTEKGWIKAGNLANGDVIFSLQNLRKLRYSYNSNSKRSLGSIQSKFYDNSFLLNLMLKKERKSNVGSWNNRKNDKYLKSYWTQTNKKRWEWSRINRTSKNNVKYSRRIMGCRTPNKNNGSKIIEDLSYLLQSRYRKFGEKNSNRTGRFLPFRKKKIIRYKKGQFFKVIRVESNTVEKSRSSIPMFNLQVSGHPSYFAGGLLVHNCHLVNPNDETMYKKFIGALKAFNPYLKVIGFTATPYRMGHGKITEDGIFTDFCYDITDMHSFNRLIAEGYMAPLIPKQTNLILDTTGVKLGSDGDYAKGDLQIAVDKYEITFEALKEAMELAHDRKHWLIFGSGIEHCDHIAEILTDLGIECKAIHSKIGAKQRDEYIEDFKSGKLRAVVNNNVLTTGFNHKAIDLIIVLRPTTSINLWVQLLGRGTRPSPETGKENCLVLDFAGNTRRLGPINDPLIPKRKGDKAGTAPVKLCNSCSCYNHASARNCTYCDAEFTMVVKINTEAGTHELIKGDLPLIELFKVDHITYAQHIKAGSKPSLKVSYYSNLKIFSEYICIEHEGYAKNKANIWWKSRADSRSPDTILSAMYLIDSLRKPSHIKVWTNKKYPEIVEVIFEKEVKWVEYDDTIPLTGGSVHFDINEFPF